MALPLFDSCCFCIPLKTGTLVLGYLHLIGSVIGIILSVMMIVGGSYVSSESASISHHEFQFGGQTQTINDEEAVKAVGVIAIAIGIILLILFLVQFVFVIFLLIGGHNGKPGHIKAYLVYSVVMLVIAVILTIISLITAPSAAIISHFITYALEIYFLLVIRSYMVKLRENPENDRAGKVYKS